MHAPRINGFGRHHEAFAVKTFSLVTVANLSRIQHVSTLNISASNDKPNQNRKDPSKRVFPGSEIDRLDVLPQLKVHCDVTFQ